MFLANRILFIFFLFTNFLYSHEISSLRTEQMLASILRSAPSGVGVVENRVIVSVNEYIERLTGYSKVELLGKSAMLLYPNREEYEFVGKEKYRQISLRGTGSVETIWKRKDGHLLDVLLSSTPLDLNDLSKGVVFTVLDITESKKVARQLQHRSNQMISGVAFVAFTLLILIIFLLRSLQLRKKAEQALLAKTNELEDYFESALDLWSIADQNGKFLRVNKAWEKTLGYSVKDLENIRYLDLVHPDDLEKTEQVGKISVNSNIKNFVNRYRCKDGTYRYIEWKSHPKDDLIYAAARDITDKIQSEQEIKKYYDDLEVTVMQRTKELNDSNERLKEFAHVVSHDLKGPLRGISTLVTYIEEDSKNLSVNQKEYFSLIKSRVKRLYAQVDGI